MRSKRTSSWKQFLKHERAREKVYESHPEICFRKLSDDDLASKNSEEGRNPRLSILEDQDPELHKEVNELVRERADGSEWHHRISKGKLDDVIDAAILAISAKRIELGARAVSEHSALPEEHKPAKDPELGIDLEIVYPKTSQLTPITTRRQSFLHLVIFPR